MIIRSRLLILTLTLCCLAGSGISTAGPQQQNHRAIIDAVKQFLDQHPDISDHADRRIRIGHLDPRLNLPACSESLQTYLAPGARTAGKTTVGVRCSAPKAWALYVPASVDLFTTVYETATNLPRGHVIAAADLQPVKHNLSSLNRGYFTDIKSLLGQQTRRRLNRGQVITPNQVKPQLLVKRGEQVDLVARDDSFAVRMSGKALMDGARGQRIRVKNLSSSRIIEGVVTQSGQVTVMN